MRARKVALLTIIIMFTFALQHPAASEVTVAPIGIAVAVELEDSLAVEMTLSNASEEEVAFKIKFDEPPEEERRRMGPRRDEVDLEGMMFAVFQANEAYAWLSDLMVGLVVERDQLDSYRNGNDWNDVEFEDYDAIVLAAGQRQGYDQQYRNNYERFCEYIDGGGAAYFETHDPNSPIHSPGDIVNNTQHRTESGTLVVSPDPDDDNYSLFAEICHESQQNNWEEGEQIEGSAWLHSAYTEDQFEDGVDDGTLEWYQVLANASNGQPGAIAYGYGRGAVMVLGHPTGHTWRHYTQDGMWGSIAAEILFYLTEMAGPKWIYAIPEEGVIAGEESATTDIIIQPIEIEEGVYEMRILFELAEPDEERDDFVETVIEISAVMSLETPTANILGVVTDAANDDPVEGARSETDAYIMARFSDEEGGYAFENMPPGEYELTFTATDYLPLIREVNLEEEDVELNVALLHSECNLSVEGIIADLAPDTDTEVDFNISNDGNGLLTYTSDRRLLGDANAEPWEWRNSFGVGQAVEDDDIYGVVFIGDQFYVSGENDGEPVIYVFSREGELVEAIPQVVEGEDGIRDLAWDGELMWGTESDDIFGFTPEGELISTLRGPFRPLTAITWDPDRQVLWIASTTRGISAIDLDGNEVAQTDRHDLRIYGLAYWRDDPDGYPLYVFNKERETNRQTVHKVNPDNDEFEFVAYLEPENGGNPVGAFITNQYDIYSWVFIDISSASRNAGGDRIDIWQIDARKDWMQIEPEAGVIEADEEQPFVLTLDATGLPPAPFEGEIVFLHDGVGGETHLPVTLNVVEGRVPTRRTLQLGLGWNMVSVNLQPDEQDVTVLTEPLVENDLLEMMKDGFGHFYNPEFGFNNIPGWFVEQGYMMKVTDDCELTLAGVSVLAEDPIDLVEGWQIVSYYPRRPVEAILALSGIVDQLLIAKDGEGQFYIPEFGFSNMGDLREGQGYQLKMDEAARLVYTLQEEEVAGIPPHSGRADIPACPGRVRRHFGTVTPTGENMSLLVLSGTPPFNSPPAEQGGVELGVYTPDSRLVGSGRFDNEGRCGVAIWGDDPTTPELDGARSDTRLEIVLQDDDGRHNPTYITLNGNGLYATDGLWIVDLDAADPIPTEFGIVSAYPNPFNSTTQIRYSLPDAVQVRLNVYDLSGRLIKELVNDHQQAGLHMAAIDGSDMASGVYVIRLDVPEGRSQMKVTLIK